ncbi:MAG: efflux RND transporter permease subunit, partial [Methylocystis sp.]
RFPHTFYVLAMLILFLGVSAIIGMPTDIFPEINIPVVSVIWQYTGLSTPEMEQRVTTYSEYSISSNVNGIKDMVLNYQNFGDPFVVILALPATFCGILTMLFITGTTLSVPSLMGAIMAIGVASANSILLVTFAREQQLAGMPAFDAAIAAGRTRIRPVLMTAMAMIVGMVPMAIGGAGEEQNAALARAVIGGLLFATPTTLLLVPYLFAILRKGNDGKAARGVFAEEV